MVLPVPIPGHVRSSPLFQNGGFAVYEGLVNPYLHQHLLDEATGLQVTARRQLVSAPDSEDDRGGTPERSLANATGGAILKAFYDSEWLITFLREATQLQLEPSGIQGTYSYYVQPGDFLALHRDIVTCELTLITTLYDDADTADQGGSLCLYPQRWQEPLSAIRATPALGAIPVHLRPGQSILLLGGIIPHLLTPVQDQKRIVSLLCFSF